MAANSGIEWTHHTFNPWWGCVKVSPACDHCYAETWAKRMGLNVWGKDSERRFFGLKHWMEPAKWNRAAEAAGERQRVFCGSMCDVMEDRPELVLGNADIYSERKRLYDLIEATPGLDWLLLTKRPQNFRRFLPAAWLENPRLNVWLMTTVESDDYLWRIDELVKVPAAVRGISYEPALGPLNIARYLQPHWTPQAGADKGPWLDWVIAGGESGPGARPANPEWFRSVRDQCADAGVAFLFKQWGEHYPITRTDGFHESPFGGHAMIRVGKKAAGRKLDGRVHDGYPELA